MKYNIISKVRTQILIPAMILLGEEGSGGGSLCFFLEVTLGVPKVTPSKMPFFARKVGGFRCIFDKIAD